MSFPGPEHFLFIPGILLIGIVIGYVMGTRTARADIEKKRKRARE
jgi:hypothetical protein